MLKLSFFVFIGVIAFSSMAQAETLRCQFKPHQVLPQQIQAKLDMPSQSAVVSIPDMPESEVRARVSEASSKRTVIAWEMMQADRRGTPAKLAFRLVHFKQNGRGLVRVQVVGYDNQYTARGTCRMAS